MLRAIVFAGLLVCGGCEKAGEKDRPSSKSKKPIPSDSLPARKKPILVHAPTETDVLLYLNWGKVQKSPAGELLLRMQEVMTTISRGKGKELKMLAECPGVADAIDEAMWVMEYPEVDLNKASSMGAVGATTVSEPHSMFVWSGPKASRVVACFEAEIDKTEGKVTHLKSGAKIVSADASVVYLVGPGDALWTTKARVGPLPLTDKIHEDFTGKQAWGVGRLEQKPIDLEIWFHAKTEKGLVAKGRWEMPGIGDPKSIASMLSSNLQRTAEQQQDPAAKRAYEKISIDTDDKAILVDIDWTPEEIRAIGKLIK